MGEAAVKHGLVHMCSKCGSGYGSNAGHAAREPLEVQLCKRPHAQALPTHARSLSVVIATPC